MFRVIGITSVYKKRPSEESVLRALERQAQDASLLISGTEKTIAGALSKKSTKKAESSEL